MTKPHAFTLPALLTCVTPFACGTDVPLGEQDVGETNPSETGVTSSMMSTEDGTETEATTQTPDETDTETSGDGDGDPGTSGVKFDVAEIGDLGDGGCGGGGGELEFSYIWIGNQAEGTVSKIDTITLTELGRYPASAVMPMADATPSRTSVNARGDVVVANRLGHGITKIYAQATDCEDKNNDNMIQTSSGPNDVLSFADEECIAWHEPMANYSDNRPVAWTNGTFNQGTCKWDGVKVWTSASQTDTPNTIDVLLLNGDTGAIEDTVNVQIPMDNNGRGLYGAAVDENDDVWFSQWGNGSGDQVIVHVSVEDLSYETWTIPAMIGSYGMSYAEGYVWICSNNNNTGVGPLRRRERVLGRGQLSIGWRGLHGRRAGRDFMGHARRRDHRHRHADTSDRRRHRSPDQRLGDQHRLPGPRVGGLDGDQRVPRRHPDPRLRDLLEPGRRVQLQRHDWVLALAGRPRGLTKPIEAASPG